MKKNEFAYLIYQTLAEHPDWHDAAIASVSAGMAEAIQRSNKRAGDCYAGMLAALSLVKSNRVTAGIQQDMRAVILKAVDAVNGCPLEKEFTAPETPR